MRKEGPCHIHVPHPTHTILSQVYACGEAIRATTMLQPLSDSERLDKEGVKAPVFRQGNTSAAGLRHGCCSGVQYSDTH
jgi:hypothetical protein